MKTTVTNYIKGCALCQSRKNNPMNPKLLLFPITSDLYTLLFTTIALDFIVNYCNQTIMIPYLPSQIHFPNLSSSFPATRQLMQNKVLPSMLLMY